MTYTCCDEKRRAAVDAHQTLNGIDWLEVLDRDAPEDSPRQKTLMVRLLKPVPGDLTWKNIHIEGGDRIRVIGIEWVGIAEMPPPEPDTSEAERNFFENLPNPDQVLLIRTDSTGDHSSYRLHLVQGSDNDAPLPNFDPRLSAIDFSFKVECPSDFDCAPRCDCPETPKPIPDINYLARDYGSLRRLVIDRLTRQMPGWRDRSPADQTTMLAEIIAYVGDLQHYQLDAVATEAYLHTARRRSSLRRHALLVDYRMHEGCNARAWVHLKVRGEAFLLPDDLRFCTHVPGASVHLQPGLTDERAVVQASPLVFEPMHGGTLREEHNDFDFYTWGDARCCLAVGATKTTLLGHWPDLMAGDVLIFQEMMGPLTGEDEDADPTHRHAVRLTEVRAFNSDNPLTDPLNDQEITEIHWHTDDALPFPLCISSITDEAHDSRFIDKVSMALGNNILADHGRTIVGEELGIVPDSSLHYPPKACNPCQRASAEPLPPHFTPSLSERPVTQQGTVLKTWIDQGMRRSERVAFDPEASAHAALKWRTADALPVINLESKRSSNDTNPRGWNARHDLLVSHAADPHFVLETEEDGSSRIRFGDNQHGHRPDVDSIFTANYRIGNGPEGNVGSNTIIHIITPALDTESSINEVTNPLPARGGISPETSAEVRRHAPHAFRTQERAVTPADYAEVTERLDGIQRAAASLRWTGSWHTVFTTVDRNGGEPVDDRFATTVVKHLDRYRMAGHDLHVNDPIHVSLEIEMQVCVKAAYFRSHVHRGLLEILSNRILPDGTHGLFHPDNFSFGQTVYLSPIYAAARQVAGVASVQITRFQRQDQEDPKPLADGYMPLSRLEIARLDNNPNFPKHGVLRLELHGGK